MTKPALPPIIFLRPVGSRLDMAAAPQFSARLSDVLDAAPAIIVDLSETTFIDSSGLGCIMAARRRLPPGCLILAGVREPVLTLLRLCRLDDVLVLADTPSTAERLAHDALKRASASKESTA